ncbi:MAG: hypothetical protein U5K38_03320 [Woeseiaceae bacterium]|nr:hypothetical protein [Woeseiaceae bacterium]
MLGTIGGALEKVESPVDEEIPDFSIYEGNYESRPWGGEAAVRQWGDKLVVIRPAHRRSRRRHDQARIRR